MSRFLAPEELLALHDQVIEASGGSHGVRELGLLESALGAPRQTFGGEPLHRDAFAQGAALMRSLAMNHPFVDGNKRTAFLSTAVFLELNGWELSVSRDEAVDFMVRLAAQKTPLEEIGLWLGAHCRRMKG